MAAGEADLHSSLSPAGRGIEGEGASPVAAAPELPPPPTMDDVAQLTTTSNYARFMASNVDTGVKNAAMKKLFTDPHYNVMDRLDTYIDDYGIADPIPASMLRQMVQSKFLGLFDDDGDEEQQASAEPTAAATPPDNPPPDDHTDLQLQPDDAAGRPGADEGVGSGTV